MSVPTSPDLTAEKRAAAEAALGYIQSGMRIGLGTGSTSEILVELLAERMSAGLQIAGAVPTSVRTEALARAHGIPLMSFDEVDELDVCLDGADEVDGELNLVKGGGGALLREKIVASASRQRVIMVDGSKPVPALGAFGLPIEVIPFATPIVRRALTALGGRPTLRRRDGQVYRTDENNNILDCDFGRIADPPGLAARLDAVTGIVEHGLFCGMTEVLIIGRSGGVEVQRGPRPPRDGRMT